MPRRDGAVIVSQKLLLVFGILFCLLGCLPAQVQAQDSNDEAAPPTFRLISLGDAEPLLYDLDGQTSKQVYLTTTNFSQPHRLPENGQLKFYRLKTNPDPALPPLRVPVVEINIPPESPKPVIIVLIPGGLPDRPVPTLTDGRSAEFSTILLDDSPEAAPRDHLRVLSFSKRPVGVKFGDQTAGLRPFEEQLIPYPDEGNRTALLVATFSMNTWQPIISNVQMLAPDTRITILFSDPPRKPGERESTDLLLRKIVEVLPPAGK